VHGTVNDLAMRGAWPLALSVSLIIEEGLPLAELRAVMESLGKAAQDVGVPVITGDTKVVGRGAADRLFINTTGVGQRHELLAPSAALARPGDAVLLSGPIGLHGTTVLSTRENLGFEGDIASDSRPLHRLVRALAPLGDAVHVLRDPTRGGLAAALNEIARDSSAAVEIEESAVPVPEAVASACDLLGLDPLIVANEGCLVAFVDADAAGDALAAMRSVPEGAQAVRIGEVLREGSQGRVTLRTLVGARRIVEMPLGEQLPRIC
jgi:hydrogenase expression/formation protein HypE